MERSHRNCTRIVTGVNVLHLAVSSGKLDAVNTQHGADVHKPMRDGATPINDTFTKCHNDIYATL